MSSMMRLRDGSAILAAAGLGLFLFSCNLSDKDLGDGPIGPGTGSGLDTSTWVRDSISGNMRIFATPQTLKAGNKARSTISVQVIDANHNPLRRRLVKFAASLGTITATDTTDEDGMATATYTGVPRNAEAHILASADVGDSTAVVGTSVQLQGLTVTVAPLSFDTLIDQAVPVTVTVRDGEGEPVAAAAVKLQGAAAPDGVTDGAGQFRTTVKSADEKEAKVTASALGAEGSATVGFWKSPFFARSRTLLLFADPPRIPAANGEAANIKAILYDENHNPVAGKRVTFSASQGLITPSDITDSAGAARAVFQGFAQNADAIITASYAQGDSVRVATTTVTLAGVQIEVKPAVEEAVAGDTVPVSIHVRDAKGQALPDVQLTLKGLLQSSLRTNPSGTATAYATSASLATVAVSASALGAGDSATLVFLKELPTGNVISKPAVGNLRIFVDRSKLKASNTDETPVRVIAFDKFNNPLAGRLVRFTANYGIITASDTTNDRGEATATYRAVPYNTDVRITASVTVEDSTLAVATTVTLTGLEVEVRPQTTDALLNATVPVSIRVLDGSGNPVPDVTVKFNGNPGFGTTDGDGIFRTAVTSGTQKRILINAEALGAQDTGFVDFWTTLPGKTTGGTDEIRKLRIFSSRSQLRADNSDFAVVTVILTNENNNPAQGEVVKFTSDLGIITQTATVDSAGRATAILHSAPVNGTCKVEATAVGRNLSASTEIVFSGVTLQLSAAQTDLKVGELASLEASLKDASGNPIGGDAVAFTLSGAGTFDNGGAAYNTVLRPDGKALVRVNAKQAGTIVARAAALNTGDSITLRFSNNTLTLSSRRDTLSVAGDTVTVTATYLKGDGSAASGQVLVFGANAGSLTRDSVVTDGNGRATTVFRSASFSGTATIQVSSPGGAARKDIVMVPGAGRKVKLTITADNIAVNGGVAQLRAEVRDANDNLVTGQNVNFRILKGPGGGERIPTPLVAAQAGVALARLEAGSIASAYRGVLVEASLDPSSADPASKDTSKLTISGPAHIVTVSRPEDDTITVPEGGFIDESVFGFNVGAVVQDINGNRVADGTEVHFSAVVSGLAIGMRLLDHWEGLIDSSGGVIIGTGQSSAKPVYKLRLFDILPFEDINNNYKYDPGIDLDLDDNDAVLRRGEDRDGDGRFDYNPDTMDTWFDFNHNGRCDAGVGENDTVVVKGKVIWADLYPDGFRNRSEVIVDRGAPGCSLPTDGAGNVLDYPYAQWEARDYLALMKFRDNDFAVTVDVSAVTKDGVAQAKLRYPRQFARRLFVTLNAEANGVRDRDGERFILPQIKQ